MIAYKNIKFEEFPDILDILNDGRKSSVGRLRVGEIKSWKKNPTVNYSRRGYCSGRKKAETRRYLKRVDRAIEAKFQKAAEGE